ncbi:MAG TPA: hypothetical protein VMS43_12360 [Allosphingosinicella sp.]|nr:hypothetical protein [Allosphingosinicella sp.]
MDEAYRLIFSFDGERVQLQSMEKLAMRVPPAIAAVSPGAEAGLVGHFVELRDAEGAALYQRPIAPPEALRLEYPTGDPERPLGRAEAAAPATMSVLVPAREAGRSVALVEAAAPPGGDAAGAEPTAESAPVRRDLISVALPAAGETDDGR